MEMKYNKQKLEDIENYKISLKKYEEELKDAKKKFNKVEKERKKKIEKHNKQIDEWKNNCFYHEQKAVEKYLKELINIIVKNMSFSIIVSMNLHYDSESKTLEFICYVDIKNNAMVTANYRYMKSSDSIVAKEDLVNQQSKIKYIFPKLAMAYTNFFFKNNPNDLIDKVLVNIHDTDNPKLVYAISSVEKEEFKLYNKRNLTKFIDNHVKMIK